MYDLPQQSNKISQNLPTLWPNLSNKIVEYTIKQFALRSPTYNPKKGSFLTQDDFSSVQTLFKANLDLNDPSKLIAKCSI